MLDQTCNEQGQGYVELLDAAEACAFLSISPATLWRGVRDGRFSRPLRLAPNAVRWVKQELQADIERLIAARDNNEEIAKRRPV